MDPISMILGGVGAAGTFAGNLMQNQANQQMQSNAQNYNTQMVNQAEQYSTEMADTTHQREVADLKAAGLNPVLSAGGSGNPAPVGQVGTTSMMPHMENMAQGVASSAKDMAMLNSQIQLAQSQSGLADAQSDKSGSERDLNEAALITETDKQNLMKAQALQALSQAGQITANSAGQKASNAITGTGWGAGAIKLASTLLPLAGDVVDMIRGGK